MKNFRVYITMNELLYIDIEADSKQDAIEIAYFASSVDFISCQNGTWDIDEELTKELFKQV